MPALTEEELFRITALEDGQEGECGTKQKIEYGRCDNGIALIWSDHDPQEEKRQGDLQNCGGSKIEPNGADDILVRGY